MAGLLDLLYQPQAQANPAMNTGLINAGLGFMRPPAQQQIGGPYSGLLQQPQRPYNPALLQPQRQQCQPQPTLANPLPQPQYPQQPSPYGPQGNY